MIFDKISAMNHADLLQEKEQTIAALSDEVVVLKQQLDWFKRQLFGRKSEQQLIENPHQKPLFEGQSPSCPPTPATDVKAHKRHRQKQRAQGNRRRHHHPGR